MEVRAGTSALPDYHAKRAQAPRNSTAAQAPAAKAGMTATSFTRSGSDQLMVASLRDIGNVMPGYDYLTA